jgi:hypothetical protein
VVGANTNKGASDGGGGSMYSRLSWQTSGICLVVSHHQIDQSWLAGSDCLGRSECVSVEIGSYSQVPYHSRITLAHDSHNTRYIP